MHCSVQEHAQCPFRPLRLCRAELRQYTQVLMPLGLQEGFALGFDATSEEELAKRKASPWHCLLCTMHHTAGFGQHWR